MKMRVFFKLWQHDAYNDKSFSFCRHMSKLQQEDGGSLREQPRFQKRREWSESCSDLK